MVSLQDHPDRILPPPKPPNNSLPIPRARIALIGSGSLGVFLSIMAMIAISAAGWLPFNLSFLALSMVLSSSELKIYARADPRDLDQDLSRPRTATMFGDLMLVGMHQFIFWLFCPLFPHAIGPLDSRYDILISCTLLVNPICSIIHIYALWKQIMVRSRRKWLRTLAWEPCARCGYHDDVAMPIYQPLPQQQPPPYSYACEVPANPPARFNMPLPQPDTGAV